MSPGTDGRKDTQYGLSNRILYYHLVLNPKKNKVKIIQIEIQK